MATVTFEHVSKKYGEVVAVDDLNLEIGDGEFMVLVGPSGCGKTTSLRMIAGLEEISTGTLRIGDRVVNDVAPKDRDIAMVFQSYALYPHMSVRDNLAFGLKLRKVPKPEIETRVKEAAGILDLGRYLDRKPKELSGGQRQRVALGRAIVREPAVFLMDEPLSNLDAKLRVETRASIARLHQRLKTTFVYVTHDQVEAMTMGSRIALMNKGRLQQLDAPETLYERPANLFAASFIGSPKMNLSPGRLTAENGATALEWVGQRFPIAGEAAAAAGKASGRELVVGVRPEDLRWEQDAPDNCSIRLRARVEVIEPLGSETFVVARVGDEVLTSRFPPRSGVEAGGEVGLAVNPEHLHLFDAQTEQNLLVEPEKAVSSEATVEESELPPLARTGGAS